MLATQVWSYSAMNMKTHEYIVLIINCGEVTDEKNEAVMGKWEMDWGKRRRECQTLLLAWALSEFLASSRKSRLVWIQLVGNIYEIEPETISCQHLSRCVFHSYHGGFRMGVHGHQGEQRGEQMKGQPWRAGSSPRFATSPPSKEQSCLFHVRILCKVTFKKKVS